MMDFRSPWILILIPVAVATVVWFYRRRRPAAMRFPTLTLAATSRPGWRVRLLGLPFFLRVLAIILFLVALAGPRSVSDRTQITSEGIDIVLAVDASGSMAAEDFTLHGQRVSRLAIVKHVVDNFVDNRPDDRIGLIAFASRAYTVCPLTLDHAWLKTNLARVKLSLFKGEDATAIGSAIAASLARLKKSDAKSKVIILLTDGMNNAGQIDPLTAANAAEALGVRIYTIGAGSKGLVPFPVRDAFGNKVYEQVKISVDDKLLKKIADLTGGHYYRATDTASLVHIYHQIDRLEKTRIEEVGYREYKELFAPVLLAGLALLVIGLILENTVFLQIP